MKKMFFFVIFEVLSSYMLFSQNIFFKVELNIYHSFYKKDINIIVYKNNLKVLVNYFIEDTFGIVTSKDTVFHIKEQDFIHIINKINELPLKSIQNFTLSNNKSLQYEGYVFRLSYGTYQNSITVNLTQKVLEQKKELNKFIEICKEMLKLAEINPEVVFSNY